MGKKHKLFALFLLLFCLTLGANFVWAERNLEVSYPTIPGTEITPLTVENTSLPAYVKYVFNFALGLAGLTALILLIYGGVKYLTSAGNPSKAKEAKDRIFAALLGVIILLSSYLILTTVNPQLVILDAPPLPEIEVAIPTPTIPDAERITSSISVELPVGTIIKDRIFSEERMAKIKDFTQRTVAVVDEAPEPGKNLADSAGQCTCDATQPVCTESCCCELICPENAECYCSNCGCGSCGCNSDPCSQVRGEMSQNEETLQSKNKVLMDLQNESNKESLVLKMELDRLEKSFKLMQECPVWGLNSLGEFLNLKDDYATYEWKLKQIRYWSDINPNFNPATFYCSIGGTRQALVPENEISPEQIENFSQDFQASQGEIQTTAISCPTPIPLGEIGDKTMSLTNKLIKKIDELIALNQKMVMAIDRLIGLTAQCSSANCGCSCGCDEGCGCASSPGCYGSPCPGGIAGAADAIGDVKDEIAAKKAEIDAIIDKEVPILLADLKDIENAIHPCISEDVLDIQLILLDCTRSLGSIGPGGKVIKTEKDCLCKTYPELCEKKFEILKGYNCETLGDCQQYNFFCCRI